MARQMAFKDKEFSSESCEHYTPPWLIEIVRDIMGGIDLDPCSSEKANLIIRASKFYTEEQDGLSVNSPWGGRIFINPPGDKRSELVIAFWRRLSDEWYGRPHGETGTHITEFCWLAYNISQLRVLQQCGEFLSFCTVAVPRKRIRFLDEDGKPGTRPTRDSAILYRGPHLDMFAYQMQKIGAVWRP